MDDKERIKINERIKKKKERKEQQNERRKKSCEAGKRGLLESTLRSQIRSDEKSQWLNKVSDWKEPTGMEARDLIKTFFPSQHFFVSLSRSFNDSLASEKVGMLPFGKTALSYVTNVGHLIVNQPYMKFSKFIHFGNNHVSDNINWSQASITENT